MYEVKIAEVSREVTAKERVMLKDVSSCQLINELTEEAIAAGAEFTFKPVLWAVLNIHNDESKESTEYTSYVIFTEDGQRLSTSSDAFYSAFSNIVSEMKDVTDEEWAIKPIFIESKNYKGKNVLTCTIV